MVRLVTILAAALVTGPATASAASTAITSPATGTRLVIAQGAPGPLHVTGTASGVAAVDLACVSSQPGGAVSVSYVAGGFNTPVAAGAFADDVTQPTTGGVCELMALDHALAQPGNDSDLAYATGARLLTATARTDSLTAGKLYDYSVMAVGTAGEYEFASFGDCTLGSYLVALHQYGGR